MKKLLKNLSQKWARIKDFFPSPSYRRTIAIVGIIFLLFAIPVTVIFLGKQTNIFQHASTICETNYKGTCVPKNICIPANGFLHCYYLAFGCTNGLYCGTNITPTPTPVPNSVVKYTCIGNKPSVAYGGETNGAGGACGMNGTAKYCVGGPYYTSKGPNDAAAHLCTTNFSCKAKGYACLTPGVCSASHESCTNAYSCPSGFVCAIPRVTYSCVNLTSFHGTDGTNTSCDPSQNCKGGPVVTTSVSTAKAQLCTTIDKSITCDISEIALNNGILGRENCPYGEICIWGGKGATVENDPQAPMCTYIPGYTIMSKGCHYSGNNLCIKQNTPITPPPTSSSTCSTLKGQCLNPLSCSYLGNTKAVSTKDCGTSNVCCIPLTLTCPDITSSGSKTGKTITAGAECTNKAICENGSCSAGCGASGRTCTISGDICPSTGGACVTPNGATITPPSGGGTPPPSCSGSNCGGGGGGGGNSNGSCTDGSATIAQGYECSNKAICENGSCSAGCGAPGRVCSIRGDMCGPKGGACVACQNGIATSFTISLKLQGIGTDSFENNAPAHTMRNVAYVRVTNEANLVVYNNSKAQFAYNSTTGLFTATQVSLGTALSCGHNYTITVKLPGYVKASESLAYAGTSTNTLTLTPIPGDLVANANTVQQTSDGRIVGDDTINILDYNVMAQCHNVDPSTVLSFANNTSTVKIQCSNIMNLFDYKDGGTQGDEWSFNYNLWTRGFFQANGY